MVKIIYGIQSDGLGHYSRSKIVIDHSQSHPKQNNDNDYDKKENNFPGG